MTLRLSQRTRSSVLLAAAYFACSALTIGLSRVGSSISLIWIANGVLIAALASLPPARWRAKIVTCLVAGCACTLLVGAGPKALGLSVLALGEGVAVALLMRKVVGHARYFASLDGVIKFLAVTALVSGVAAAAAGPAAWFALGGSMRDHSFNWLAGHVLGTVVVTPMIMLTTERRRGEVDDARCSLRDAALWLAPVLVVTLLTFGQARYPLLFAPLIPIMIATLRLGRLGAVGSIAILVVVASALTGGGWGPVRLIDISPVAQLQFLQFYIACAAALALVMAALFEQRRIHVRDLQASAEGYRLLTEHSGDVLLHCAPDGTICRAIGAVRALVDREADAVLGINAAKLLHPDDVKRVIDAQARLLDTPEVGLTFEYRVKLPDGRLRWCETRARAIVGANGRAIGTVSAIREIEHRKQAEAELVRAATTDALTGLLNRRAFIAQLDQLDRTTANCLAIIDLDHFKLINDRYGHATGDEALKLFARLARGALRQRDAIGRIGGEEFAILLRGVGAGDAERLCERLRQRIGATPLELDAGTITVTASVGISLIRRNDTPGSALAAADAALYRAKAAGRNCLQLAA